MQNIVYHGSPDNLEVIKAHKSTHQKTCIYASPKKEVALLFSAKGNGDLDLRISKVDGHLEVVERRSGVLKNLYDKSGYLYELDGQNFSSYDYLWSLEVISFLSSITPLKKVYYPNILRSLTEEEEKGNLKIYRYPERPSDMPLDNSDLIAKYTNYEKQGIKGSISYLLSIYPELYSSLEPFYQLRYDIEKCRQCAPKFGFEPKPLFFGHQNSKIVQISQAPSAQAGENNKPFTDMSGKTLKYEWYQIKDEDFYNQDNFFIGAMAHCYPGKDKNGNDRTPPKCCFDLWVKKELELVDNEIYILIGAKSAHAFFPEENFEDLVFKNNYLNGKLTLVLPHPSPLNRRWLRTHPLFMESRIHEVRKLVKDIINNK